MLKLSISTVFSSLPSTHLPPPLLPHAPSLYLYLRLYLHSSLGICRALVQHCLRTPNLRMCQVPETKWQSKSQPPHPWSMFHIYGFGGLALCLNPSPVSYWTLRLYPTAQSSVPSSEFLSPGLSFYITEVFFFSFNLTNQNKLSNQGFYQLFLFSFV